MKESITFLAAFRLRLRSNQQRREAMRVLGLLTTALLAGGTARAEQSVMVYAHNSRETGGALYQVEARASQAFGQVGMRIDWLRPPIGRPIGARAGDHGHPRRKYPGRLPSRCAGRG